MLEKNLHRTLFYCKSRFIITSVLLCLTFICTEVQSCSPGRSGARRRSARKLTPLVFKQHVPNVPEHSFGASGPPEGRIWRDDARFKNLVPNYNSDIVFKDEEGTGVDRLMTRRCKEKLDVLAISVMNMWPGVRLRVTEGFDEDGHHPKNSLHYEGRAVAISTSDRDISKYGMLARLAVDAGFDWVFYESRSHIYCSVKIESTVPGRFSGCFHGTSEIMTKNGSKLLKNVFEGEEILSTIDYNSLSYSKVIGFLHRDPNQVTSFVQIYTSLNNTLLVTTNHLIFKGRKYIHAEKLDAGDNIMSASNDGSLVKSTVISTRILNLTGVYAPLTESGTIVVDGVLCSCYAVIEHHELAHFAFLPLRIKHKFCDSMIILFGNAYNFFADWVCPLGVEQMNYYRQDITKPYIHWYAKHLCDLYGLVFSIC